MSYLFIKVNIIIKHVLLYVFPFFCHGLSILPRKRAELASALRTSAANPDAGLAEVFRRCLNLVHARQVPHGLLRESLGSDRGGGDEYKQFWVNHNASLKTSEEWWLIIVTT